MARVPNEVIFSPGWFHPERYRDLSKVSHAAVNAAAKNKEQSQVENFMEGSAGFNYGLPNDFTFGVSLYGSGGMHTKYDENRMTANTGARRFDGSLPVGPFGADRDLHAE